MLDTQTKKKIDNARDILVGKVPVPSSQVEQITIALIYKFMYDMDAESMELGGNPLHFTGEYAKYSWERLFDARLGGEERIDLYQEALEKIRENPDIPALFRDIFKNAFLPYRDPNTLRLFLHCINEFTYDHSEKLGDAFEYLLAILGSQGDAGQFRTPRHIIDFIVALIDPKKDESILDPACGTAGFLISAYKHILKTNSSNYDPKNDKHTFEVSGTPLDEVVINGKHYQGDRLLPNELERIHSNIKGYDIAFEMVRLSVVNMFLHGFNTPKIHEYDTLSSEDRWNELADVILANPPFMTPKGGITPHQRFSVRSKRSEILFVDYIMEHLTANGRAGVIVPEGVIFQSANAYKQLRKTLVEENYLVGVISLPAGVFNPYSGVKTSILWIDKRLARQTDKIIFLKVENDGYNLGTQRRAIQDNDLPEIITIAEAYKKALQNGEEYNIKTDKSGVLVQKSIIADGGDYPLNAERYQINTNTFDSTSMIKLGSIMKKTKSVDPRKYPDDVFELWSIPSYESRIPEILTGEEIGSQKKIIYPGDVLLSRIVPHIRRSWVATPNLLGYKQIASTEWIVFSGDNVIPEYLRHILISDEFHKQFMKTVTGVGGSLSRASLSAVETIAIPLPPLSVQQEIVEELESYQKIIDGAKQVVENWRPRMEVDAEWEQVKIGDVVSINQKIQAIASYDDEMSVSFLPMKDVEINKTYVEPADIKPIKDVRTKGYTQFQNDDVLLAKITPCFENGKISIPKNLTNNLGFGSTEFHVLRCSEDVMPEIIYLYLSSEKFRNYATALMTGSAGQKRVPKEAIANYNVYLPSLSEQQVIVNELKTEIEQINILKDMAERYEGKIKRAINKLWRSDEKGKKHPSP